MRKGWVKAHRARFDHDLFRNEKLCRLAAWDWLCAAACHKPTKFDVKGKTIVVGRGQLVTSLRHLAVAWKWSIGGVQRFLTRLKTDSMIESETDSGQLIITICNYSFYQSNDDAPDSPSDSPSDSKSIQERFTKEESKNVKKENRPSQPSLLGANGVAQKDAFDEWWKIYPRKEDKRRAEQSFRSALKKVALSDLMLATRNYAQWVEKEGTERRFIKLPSGWLNAERWNDWMTRQEEPSETMKMLKAMGYSH